MSGVSEATTTELFIAAQTGDIGTIKTFLRTHSVDLTLKHPETGDSVLHLIIANKKLRENDKLDVFRNLAVYTIPFDSENFEGVTPLHLAAEAQLASVVDWLLTTAKVSVDHEDHTGATPLHYALRGLEANCPSPVSKPLIDVRGVSEMKFDPKLIEKIESLYSDFLRVTITKSDAGSRVVFNPALHLISTLTRLDQMFSAEVYQLVDAEKQRLSQTVVTSAGEATFANYTYSDTLRKKLTALYKSKLATALVDTKTTLSTSDGVGPLKLIDKDHSPRALMKKLDDDIDYTRTLLPKFNTLFRGLDQQLNIMSEYGSTVNEAINQIIRLNHHYNFINVRLQGAIRYIVGSDGSFNRLKPEPNNYHHPIGGVPNVRLRALISDMEWGDEASVHSVKHIKKSYLRQDNRSNWEYHFLSIEKDGEDQIQKIMEEVFDSLPIPIFDSSVELRIPHLTKSERDRLKNKPQLVKPRLVKSCLRSVSSPTTGWRADVSGYLNATPREQKNFQEMQTRLFPRPKTKIYKVGAAETDDSSRFYSFYSYSQFLFMMIERFIKEIQKNITNLNSTSSSSAGASDPLSITRRIQLYAINICQAIALFFSKNRAMENMSTALQKLRRLYREKQHQVRADSTWRPLSFFQEQIIDEIDRIDQLNKEMADKLRELYPRISGVIGLINDYYRRIISGEATSNQLQLFKKIYHSLVLPSGREQLAFANNLLAVSYDPIFPLEQLPGDFDDYLTRFKRSQKKTMQGGDWYRRRMARRDLRPIPPSSDYISPVPAK